VSAPLPQRLLAGGQAAADQQQPTVGEVDVLPSQGQHFPEPESGVEEQSKRLGVTAILLMAGLLFGGVLGRSGGTVLTDLAATG
jgi:hypothetical protein